MIERFGKGERVKSLKLECDDVLHDIETFIQMIIGMPLVWWVFPFLYEDLKKRHWFEMTVNRGDAYPIINVKEKFQIIQFNSTEVCWILNSWILTLNF